VPLAPLWRGPRRGGVPVGGEIQGVQPKDIFAIKFLGLGPIGGIFFCLGVAMGQNTIEWFFGKNFRPGH